MQLNYSTQLRFEQICRSVFNLYVIKMNETLLDFFLHKTTWMFLTLRYSMKLIKINHSKPELYFIWILRLASCLPLDPSDPVFKKYQFFTHNVTIK